MIMTPENELEKRRLLREWSKKAVPMNYWWKKVENMQHYDGDRTERDFGDPTGIGGADYKEKV